MTATETGPIGRVEELRTLVPLLLSPERRLLTLTGPPGVGKTTLAAGLAAAVADRFPDGVSRVDVLSCSTAEEAATLVASRLELGRGHSGPATERLSAHLRERTSLLVLDSCEAVPDLGRLVAALLAGARRLTVVATSQSRLRIASEHEYAVPPLAMPTGVPGSVEVESLAEVPAMAMLLASTRAVRPDFVLDSRNVAPMVSICRRLEGLPLALEVAAARLTSFEPAELDVRLGNRHRLLDARLSDSGRHRSLGAAIGWSHDLLGMAERRVFRSVSVFPGAWSPEAAESVVDDSTCDVLAAVEALVARNLVRRLRRADGRESFDQLDTLRRFGREELERAGEEAGAEARFRDYYAQLAAAAEATIGTVEETRATQWVAEELDNLRRALVTCTEAGDLSRALALGSALGWFWYTRGLMHEGVALARLVDDPRADPEAGAGAVLVAGVLAWGREDTTSARGLLTRALRLAEQHDVVRRSAIAHAFLGHVARTEGDLARARQEHGTALAAYRSLGSDRGAAWAGHDLGLVALQEGDLVEAAELFASALADFETDGDAWAAAWAGTGLAEVRLRQGEVRVAVALLDPAMQVYAENGDARRLEHCRDLLGAAAEAHGLGAAAREVAEAPPARLPALVRSLGASLARPGSPLTPRQREVAVLVAQGSTNRQIARSLGITDKTVEVHLAQIMARIGVQNRAQVAAHAVQSGLVTASH